MSTNPDCASQRLMCAATTIREAISAKCRNLGAIAHGACLEVPRRVEEAEGFDLKLLAATDGMRKSRELAATSADRPQSARNCQKAEVATVADRSPVPTNDAR
ncbi:hypothetical protein BQ8794_30108 [Mesorhizobium prunaredense]|uniref:Uncharacterized protein n=1 Tax=Mesorhizobium prunaredense TaxID=1631249 RepID=A0A1R3V9V6_9HYPH|nr:hypothetical protein BQ8794_30108 [Mesorhizobium prunaredense]